MENLEADISYQEKLRALLKSIKTWENYAEFRQEQVIEGFMDDIGQLYLDYFQHHLEEANKIGLEFSAEIKASIRSLNFLYVNRVDSRLSRASSWADLWIEACWAATNIKAFEVMFKDLGYTLNADDIWEYIDNLKESKELEPDERPKNLPQDHWWWFTKYNLTGDYFPPPPPPAQIPLFLPDGTIYIRSKPIEPQEPPK